MEISYEKQVEQYLNYLKEEERSRSTRRQYGRDIRCFFASVGQSTLTKESVVEYKKALEQQYRPATVNAKLSALNSFFAFTGRKDLQLKLLKIQRKAYCPQDRELSKGEYLRLVNTAERSGNKKLSLILQTICATGIRVSELESITAEAVCRGEAAISLKGKNRTILIPGKLQKCLKKYLKHEQITTGCVFITRTGNPLDRSNIWRMMNALCRKAGVEEKKAFPHNLRHLFARCFYTIYKDIAKLADILGHSSINTTRIYIATSGTEHRRQLDALGLAG